MTAPRKLVALALTVATPAYAHNWDAKPIENPSYGSPFEAWEGWRLIGVTPDEQGAAFIGIIERAGASVTFETVVVYRERVSRITGVSIDQEHAHWLGDCDTSLVRKTYEQDFAFGETAPPPPIQVRPGGADQYSPGLVTVRPGTLLATALQVACRFDYNAEAVIVPYAAAREYFQSNPAKP